MADRWMNYEDAGRLFGLSAEAMRKRARRLGWDVRQPNEPGARAEVRVPDGAELRPPAHDRPVTGRSPPGHRPDALADELRRRAETAEARAERAEDERDALAAELIQERERRARAEGELAGARDALERERAQANAERTERQAVGRERDALRGELVEWTAGGPLARAWRALLYRRGR